MIKTGFGEFRIGQPVIYSVYPEVWRGTGVITEDGVKSTGETLAYMEAHGIGDTCDWEHLHDLEAGK